MSRRHPIIAITGSSGAGTSTARLAFEHLLFRLDANAAFIQGDAFHRFERREMERAIARGLVRGENFSHFGPEANHLEKLENLFKQYGETGAGFNRLYLHTEDEAAQHGQQAGTFTPWEPLPDKTDLLFYEGLHGGVVTDRVNIARHVDLLIGVAPTINLEWIQKIRRDTDTRGKKSGDVQRSILARMHDYVTYITPQFSRTDINFQRVPLVDTSNPFIARDIPSEDESFVVIRFRNPRKHQVDFPWLLAMLKDSFMSRPNTLVVPGGKLRMAMEIILKPILDNILTARNELE